jgi:hypothetical protein
MANSSDATEKGSRDGMPGIWIHLGMGNPKKEVMIRVSMDTTQEDGSPLSETD